MHLIINSYGASLQKENNLFVISSPEGKQTFPADIVKTISISKSARISSDAVLLAIKNQVDILFVNDIGMPEGRVWSVQYGSISNIRKAQLQFIYSSKMVDWAKVLLNRKLESQVALLLTFQPDSSLTKIHNVFKSSINSIEDYARKISQIDSEMISDAAPGMRGWEGASGKKYFQCISLLMPENYRFHNRDRQPAKDPFNAMLNYAYGIMYGKVEGALIKAGIDPYVGIFHRDEYNRPALVYDIIELYRAWMDYIVIRLCMEEAIPIEAFENQEHNGAILLGPLAKRILIQSVNDYLDEIINMNGKNLSRINHIESEAHSLAKLFLKEDKNDFVG
jgi:CRISPR-associated protein Cas1